MRENSIEITDDRGIEFYFIPELGSKKLNPNTSEYIYALNYLNSLIEGIGCHSERIGLNGSVETIATFISQMIRRYEFELIENK